jgi:hypothetical protein
MKAHLLFRDRDFDVGAALPANHEALTRDLGLAFPFEAMAAGDAFLREVIPRVLLSGMTEPSDIAYRQDVLRDCLRNPSVVHEIYALAVEAIEWERKHWTFGTDYPAGRLYRAVEVLQDFVAVLRRLRRVAELDAHRFRSEGFAAFFAMLRLELGDDFFAEVDGHLRRLRFREGTLISAGLGAGNKAVDMALRRPGPREPNWFKRLFKPGPPELVWTLPPRDENGARAMSEIRNQGVALVAAAMAESTEHILNFFKMLQIELAFFIGCVNLETRLVARGASIAFPEPLALGERHFSCLGLYDASLALMLGRRITGSDVTAAGVRLVVVTGANQGGKSTFLRAVGLAHLMMQAGMFVAADAFCANVPDGLFTHFRREEDATMQSGKLDEELGRMSAIADELSPHSLVLFNESFAATNEREGSEIARQIVHALTDRGIEVFFVTHMYDLAHGFHQERRADTLFLRAERLPGGTRTFRMIEGAPIDTSFGDELYGRLFSDRAVGRTTRPVAETA